MTDTTKTTKTSKAKSTAELKAQNAALAATGSETHKSTHQFDNSDDLAHFIHHNPEFGTLALDEQDALRAELINLKRNQTAE